ncbi:DUF2750 domain-containing protein [Shewanella maritima]|uniref:DUF2750 domain-containing protein n=1 Tax=Shewanella maritima TaxID=2520507 RepID=UPI003735D182
MTQSSTITENFVTNIKENQILWGLQDESGEGWVVCDSAQFEETDVMPLWSTQAAAKSHCSDEWADYHVTAITLADFLEFWVGDLNEDGVLVGIDWEAEEECLELEPVEIAKELVDVEEE